MWRLFCHYLVLISPSFGALGRLLRDCDISWVSSHIFVMTRDDTMTLSKAKKKKKKKQKKKQRGTILEIQHRNCQNGCLIH